MRTRDGRRDALSTEERRGRRRLVPIVILAMLTLVAGVTPAAAATPSLAPAPRTSPVTVDGPASVADAGAERTVDDWDMLGGEALPVTPLAATCGGAGQDPCPASELVSGGGGGFIPVAAEQILDTVAAGRPLDKRETRTLQVGGTGSVPMDGVQALALSITALNATAWTEITAWAAGLTQPSAETLDAQPGSAHRVLALVPPSTNGRISVANAQGTTDLQVDVIGWFSSPDELRAVTPARVLDTNPGKGKPAPLGPDETVTVKVIDRTGIPATGVEAVVLVVSSRTSTLASPVRLWPTGSERPDGASLIAQPLDRRGNLVIVAPGTGGNVSIHNTAGWTHLAIDVVAWIPDDGSYHPVAAASVYATPVDGSLAAGDTVEITVAGQGGVPALPDASDEDVITEQASSVVLVTTARPLGVAPTSLTLWPADDDQPETTSLATSNASVDTSSTTIVPLSGDGKVKLANLGPAARVTVQVAGWFASPVVAAQLEVPETTVVPPQAAVEEVALTTDPDDPETVTAAVVTLDADQATGIEQGDHIVLGITADTPDGYLGTVETVVPQSDGTLRLTTTAAKLVDVFPEGDITFDVAANQPVSEAAPGVQAITVAMPVAMTTAVMADASTTAAMTDPTQDPDKPLNKVPNAFDDDDQPACSAAGLVLDYGPFFDMQFGVSWRGLSAPLVTAMATIGAEANLRLEDVVLTCGWDKVVFKTTYTFVVGGVPIVLATKVTAELDLDAGLRNIDLAANAKVWVTFGIERNQPKADAGYAFHTSDMGDLMAQAAYLTAYAQVDTWVDVGVMLYGVIGPSVGVGPFLETRLSARPTDPPTPWWTLDIGMAGRASIHLDLWFYEHTWKVAEGEIPLAWLLNKVGALPACGGESKAFVVGGIPCMTPKPTERANGSTRTMAERVRLASSTTSIDPLRIVVPNIPILGPGADASLAFTATGQYVGIDGVLWRVAPDADGSPGTGIPGLAFTRAAGDPLGWSSTGVLAGRPTRVGTFNIPIEVRYTDEGPHPENADREVTPIQVRVVSNRSWVVAWGWNADGQANVPDDLGGPILVDAGFWHTLALTRSGALVGWGNDSYGQSTAPASLTGIAGLAAGAKHSLAILDNAKIGDASDNTVVAWGANDYGISTPPADLMGVKAVAASYSLSAALKTDGTVVEWGFGAGGQTAVPDVLEDPATANVVAISVGMNHSVALRGNGTVMAWGRNELGQLNVPSALMTESTAHVVAIAAGDDHTIALRADGTVVGWGSNGQGQVTIPTELRSPSTAHVTAIEAGGRTSVALRADGTITVWGASSDGQLNVPAGLAHVVSVSVGEGHIVVIVSMDQTVTVGALPTTTIVGHALAISATASSGLAVTFSSLTSEVCTVTPDTGVVTPVARGTCSIALDQEGDDTWNPAARVLRNIAIIGTGAKIVGWGLNASQQVTIPSDLGDVVTIGTGDLHSAALLANGTVRAWGDNTYGQSVVPAGVGNVVQLSVGANYNVVLFADGTVRAWGQDHRGQVSQVNAAGLTGVVAIAAGGSHTLFLMGDGTARAYGNPDGRIVVPVNLDDVVAVAAGGYHSMALKADGTVVAWRSANYDYGQEDVPSNAHDVVAIAAGFRHSLALRSDGTVVAWGDNSSHQCDVPAGLDDVIAVAAGSYHSMALKADGTVVAWGASTGTYAHGQSTVPPTLQGVASIAAGGYHSLALVEMEQTITMSGPEAVAAGGSAMVHATASSGLPVTFSSLTPDACTVDPLWGSIRTLGTDTCTIAGDQAGNATWHPAPQATWSIDLVLADQRTVVWGDVSGDQPDVPGVLDIAEVAAGDDHTIALLRDGTVIGWGADYAGQATPPADLDRVTAVAAAGNWSMALRDDGTVMAWGDDGFGQRDVPVGLTNVTAIAAGSTFGVALRADGTVVRWGDDGDPLLVPPDGLAGVTAIAAGADHALAVVDGAVIAWGHDDFGQLAVPEDLDAVTAVAAGNGFSLALRDDGSVRGWGWNDRGQADAPAWLAGVTRIAAGGSHAMALVDGGVVSWGDPDYGLQDVPPGLLGVTAIAAGAFHSVAVAGRVDQVILFKVARPAIVGSARTVGVWTSSGLTPTYGSATPDVCEIDPDAGVVHATAAGSCLLTADQPGNERYLPASTATLSLSVLAATTAVVAWGADEQGQTDVPDGLSGVVSLVAGTGHSLALLDDGSVVGWGLDDAGQANRPAGMQAAVAIAAGGHHSLALLEDGTIAGWGLDDAGQATPPDLAGGSAVAIAAGDRHSLALLWGGQVVAWGDDTFGQATVPDLPNDVIAIAAAGDTSYALLGDGAVVVWGANAGGQAAPPTDLPAAIGIAAGPEHALALVADGTVRAWGDPDQNRLAVPDDLSNAVAIAAGGAYSLALRVDGTVVAWGDGAGATTVPDSLSNVVAIAAGEVHGLALTLGE